MKLEGYFDEDPITEQMFQHLREMNNSIEHDVKKLQAIAIAADRIMREELEKSSIQYDFAEVRIVDRKTVGVVGDARVYGQPAILEIKYKGNIVWNEKFIRTLSNRMTNEVTGLVRVTYTIATQDDLKK